MICVCSCARACAVRVCICAICAEGGATECQGRSKLARQYLVPLAASVDASLHAHSTLDVCYALPLSCEEV
jgi:hypothetical protein